jgi:predicted RNase H-like HicB family nuclease
MKRPFTAVVKQDGKWWIVWIEEVPGVNCQGRTKKELLDNLRSALEEMLELNREEALKAAAEDYIEESILV